VFSLLQAYFLPTHGNGEVPVLGKLPYVELRTNCSLISTKVVQERAVAHFMMCLLLTFQTQNEHLS
jgi:hypothetical protein